MKKDNNVSVTLNIHSNKVVDLGKHKEGSKVNFKITLNQNIIINNVTKTCGCTNVKFNKNIITGSIKLGHIPPVFEGNEKEFSKYIIVKYSGEVIKINLKAVVYREPSNTNYDNYEINEGSNKSETSRIEELLGKVERLEKELEGYRNQAKAQKQSNG